MGSNGIVTETAHLKIDKKKYDDNYDRIFNAECIECGAKYKKHQMNAIMDNEGKVADYICNNCLDKEVEE